MKNLIAVYQKFKHLDKLLSDGHMMSYKAENKISNVCHKLWMAIKAAQVPDMPVDKPFIDLGGGVECGYCNKRFCACPNRVAGVMGGQYPAVIDPRTEMTPVQSADRERREEHTGYNAEAPITKDEDTDFICPDCKTNLYKRTGPLFSYYGCDKCRRTYRVDEVEAPNSKYNKK